MTKVENVDKNDTLNVEYLIQGMLTRHPSKVRSSRCLGWLTRVLK